MFQHLLYIQGKSILSNFTVAVNSTSIIKLLFLGMGDFSDDVSLHVVLCQYRGMAVKIEWKCRLNNFFVTEQCMFVCTKDIIQSFLSCDKIEVLLVDHSYLHLSC